MGKSSAPPLDGEAIRRARVRKFLSQDDVEQLCAERGVSLDRSSLSLIESGKVKRPALKVIPVLAEVLGLEVDEMFADEDAA